LSWVAHTVLTNRPLIVTGLFPEFRNGSLGGIEGSASIAWNAVSANNHAELVCYENPHGLAKKSRWTVANARLRSALAVRKQRERSGILLIWHIGLLKLLPFFRTPPQKVVLFMHGIEIWRYQDLLTRRLLKRVDLFLTNSDHTWERFLSFNPELEAVSHRTVWLGMDVPLTIELKPPDAVPKAMMLSRLSQTEDYKGHRELISAWSSVVKKIPSAQLLIAGDGDLRTELEQLVKENQLTASVRFLGRISESEKQKLLESSRCLVMPSRAEGFGLVYLEAMRMGRPCLVSTVDAGREVINPPEAGLAVNPDDKFDLADSICRLLRDGVEWRQWSEQARRRYEENYTAKHFQERLLAALFQDQR
jgi:phosphatidylinositol alpha-1,6-mannosyltransferase